LVEKRESRPALLLIVRGGRLVGLGADDREQDESSSLLAGLLMPAR
jgi:hypothetical protein